MDFLDRAATELTFLEVIGELFTPPTAGRMTLLKWVLNLVYAVHLPFIGILIAGTTLSLLLNLLHKDGGRKNLLRFSREIMGLVTVNRGVGFALGWLPLIVLLTVYGQIVYTYHEMTYYTWFAVIGLAAVGLCLVYRYHGAWEAERETKWARHFLTGLTGVGLLLPTYVLLFANVVIAATPERWPLINDPTDLLFSWNILWRFGQFSALAWAIFGAYLLVCYFHNAERRQAMDEKYAKFVRKVATGITLAFTLQIPAVLLLELWNSSNLYLREGWSSLTPPTGMFDAALVTVLLCAGVAHLCYVHFVKPETRYGAHMFVMLLGVTLAWSIGGQLQMGAALREHELVLDAMAAEAAEKRKDEVNKSLPAPSGEEVFLKYCKQCHNPDFVTDGTGPALLRRLPEYRGDRDKLKKWILSGGTTGKEAKFSQPMPAQPVRGREMNPLLDYLLKRLEEGK